MRRSAFPPARARLLLPLILLHLNFTIFRIHLDAFSPQKSALNFEIMGVRLKGDATLFANHSLPGQFVFLRAGIQNPRNCPGSMFLAGKARDLLVGRHAALWDCAKDFNDFESEWIGLGHALSRARKILKNEDWNKSRHHSKKGASDEITERQHDFSAFKHH